MTRRRWDLTIALARLAIMGVLLTSTTALPVALAASIGVYFAAFSLAHDLSHGAFGLRRRVNDVLLTFAAVPLLTSGRAMRYLHLRHHARPLADDDIEGRGARRSWLGALVSGPADAVALRLEALTTDLRPRRQYVEHALVVALLVTAAVAPLVWLRTFVAVAIALGSTMSLWASHVPHNAPRWLTRAAAAFAFTGSPMLLSLAFHDQHHRRPGVPCAQLGRRVAIPTPISILR